MFRVSNAGSVYIGSNLNGSYFNDYRLYVEKGIRAERVRVDIAADNGWADFVFDEDYELMTIAELRAYIKEHKHLPNVPSAAQVQEEGIDLAEMNAILLRQIEELTLRVIQLEEKIVQKEGIIGVWKLDSVISKSINKDTDLVKKSKSNQDNILVFNSNMSYKSRFGDKVVNGTYTITGNVIQYFNELQVLVGESTFLLSNNKLRVADIVGRGSTSTIFVYSKYD